ncbi:MAG: HmuY family protein [Flavobacteriales bacterium]|nr:HmuY family protein [Flavobacteriales bacterium]
MKKWIYLLIAIPFFACERGEIPVKPHESGEATEQQIELGEDYRHQHFYDLESNQIVASNLKTAWDFAFSPANLPNRIILNSAKGMKVHRSTADFSTLTEYSGDDWHWDLQTGHLDSTAFGELSTSLTYVIDRGYDWEGSHLGYYKMRIIEIHDNFYTIERAPLSSATGTTIDITRNSADDFAYFHCEDGLVNIAPPVDEWDLMFTQYTHLFEDPPTPYVVTGVLLNRYETLAAETKDISFQDLTYEDVLGLYLTGEIDEIGYNWKVFDFDSGNYLTHSDQVYVIKTSEGLFFKLHFIDFHNESGIKGYPTFEIQPL